MLQRRRSRGIGSSTSTNVVGSIGVISAALPSVVVTIAMLSVAARHLQMSEVRVAAIYQNSADPMTAPSEFFGVEVSELVLITQGAIDPDTGKPRGINDMNFRSIDGQMADALRTRLGLASGTPILLKVTSAAVTDAATSPLGTVLRLKVKGAFVP